MNYHRYIIPLIFLLIFKSLLPNAKAAAPQDDPLRHGHALLIGNYQYIDTHWPLLTDIPLQIAQLKRGLSPHFDTIDEVINVTSDELFSQLDNFLRKFGNDPDARLFIYYAGHGYTETISERNERRGYITGIDTPTGDNDKARLRSLSMLRLRSLIVESRARSILVVLDSCFAGTIFTDRSFTPETPLSKERISELLERQARDFITAGNASQQVPAHSPIPDLLLSAISGEADRYNEGVVSSSDIQRYLIDRIRSPNLTPQEGTLDDPAFSSGSFLFRVLNMTYSLPNENEVVQGYRAGVEHGDSDAEMSLGELYEDGDNGLLQDLREAARLYKLAADQGNAIAQVDLGLLYVRGDGGLQQDDREAARLFKLAADHGNAAAQFHLGQFYEQGEGGLQKDKREAARLYKLAARQGDALGQVGLGLLYEEGDGGVPRDLREAARLFKLAADQGNVIAQFSLGDFYERGEGGLAQNKREAARLYKLAADQGDATGQLYLGGFYERGEGGLAQDKREAARLYKLAADQGDARGQDSLADFYERGEGGLPRDKHEAARLHKLAADQLGSDFGLSP